MKLMIIDREDTLCAPVADGLRAPEDWRALPDAMEAVAQLNHADWQICMAINLPGLALGWYDMIGVNAIHARMFKDLTNTGGRIEAIFFCPHAPDAACPCHKPQTGLFEQIAQRHQVAVTNIHAVGSGMEHIQAAHAAGCVPHWLGNAAAAPDLPAGTTVHANLAAFATHLIDTPPDHAA